MKKIPYRKGILAFLLLKLPSDMSLCYAENKQPMRSESDSDLQLSYL